MKRLRLAALISGGGRSLLNLAGEIARGRLDAAIPLVVSSRREVAGVERARLLGWDVRVLRPKDFDHDLDAYSDRLFAELRPHEPDYVCLLGFLTLLRIPRDFERRVINIHPALLPEFGGEGMYGMRVHRAVLEAGRSESGCTVHFCDDEYDHGEIVLQKRCPVLPDDSADSLAARVFEVEKLAFPEALRKLADNE